VEADYAWSHKVVLVVEDDPSSQLLLKAILSKTGIKIIVVDNGNAAIQLIKDAEKVDLILMDIKLKGISGLEATRQIKSIMPNMPVIAQTACAISGDMEKCIAAGCSAYLTKPISSSKLLETIDYFFRRSKAQELVDLVSFTN
jgi:CheY-like chemotaxis protein